MDTFAALALATDPASPVLLKRKPDPVDAPLISASSMLLLIERYCR
jgi:Ca2+-transporting ATPase